MSFQRKFVPKLESVRVVLTQEKPPVRNELTWYQEQDRRSAWLRAKWAHLASTPRRREPPKFEGYVPAPYNSGGVKIRGVSPDGHR